MESLGGVNVNIMDYDQTHIENLNIGRGYINSNIGRGNINTNIGRGNINSNIGRGNIFRENYKNEGIRKVKKKTLGGLKIMNNYINEDQPRLGYSTYGRDIKLQTPEGMAEKNRKKKSNF